jgi:hypothetical protein
MSRFAFDRTYCGRKDFIGDSMNSRAHLMLVAALLSCVCGNVHAQAMQKVPILDDGSYFVLRVNLDKLDMDGVAKWLDERVARAAPESAKAAMQQDLATGMQQAKARMQGLIDGGSSVVYMTFAAFPPNEPCFFFAKSANADGNKLVAAVQMAMTGRAQPMPAAQAQDNQLVIEPLGDGVFAGTARDFRHFQQNAVGAPQLMFRLDSLPASAVQGAAMPNDAIVQLLEAQPNLPPPLNMPTTTITQGITAITLSGDLPPKLSAELIVQAPDAEKAKDLQALAAKLNALYTSPAAKRAFAGVDMQKMAEALAPKLQPDNSLVIKVQDAQIGDALGEALVMGLLRSRQIAQIVKSASMIRQQLMGVLMYQNQNKAFPDSLQQVVDAGLIGAQAMQNPRGANAAEDYIYRKPAGAAANNPGHIIIYENPADLPPGTEMLNAGFSDGHVESIRAADLQARLAR